MRVITESRKKNCPNAGYPPSPPNTPSVGRGGAVVVRTMEAPLASPLTIFTTAVNFTLGAGVLGLPYAMRDDGATVVNVRSSRVIWS